MNTRQGETCPLVTVITNLRKTAMDPFRRRFQPLTILPKAPILIVAPRPLITRVAMERRLDWSRKLAILIGTKIFTLGHPVILPRSRRRKNWNRPCSIRRKRTKRRRAKERNRKLYGDNTQQVIKLRVLIDRRLSITLIPRATLAGAVRAISSRMKIIGRNWKVRTGHCNT